MRLCSIIDVNTLDTYKMFNNNNIGINKILIHNFHQLMTSYRISKCQN